MLKENRERIKGPRPPLNEGLILSWADVYFQKNGTWPSVTSGSVDGHADEVWGNIDGALQKGHRGLPSGSSLATLLKERRGKLIKCVRPRITVDEVLLWADYHLATYGIYPKQSSGIVDLAPTVTWHAVDVAIRNGIVGLPGGSSLPRLLQTYRGRPNQSRLPKFTQETVLAWADEHHRRTGQWPKPKSGIIEMAPSESWSVVDAALRQGIRGLSGRSSLARLLHAHRGVLNGTCLPRFTEAAVLEWADEHYRRTGQWPIRSTSGVIDAAPTATWSIVNRALQNGLRGLSGGSSLARLLDAQRCVPNKKHLPRFTKEVILEWADEHFQRTGEWPNSRTGVINAAPTEKWNNVQRALLYGMRGFPGGSSLARFLVEYRGKTLGHNGPYNKPLNISD